MRDVVDYAEPFGPLGSLAIALLRQAIQRPGQRP
jgi:hypothetical protein